MASGYRGAPGDKRLDWNGRDYYYSAGEGDKRHIPTRASKALKGHGHRPRPAEQKRSLGQEQDRWKQQRDETGPTPPRSRSGRR